MNTIQLGLNRTLFASLVIAELVDENVSLADATEQTLYLSAMLEEHDVTVDDSDLILINA